MHDDVKKCVEIVENSALDVGEIADKLVSQICDPLDSYIGGIFAHMQNPDNANSFIDEQIERIIVRIPAELFFVSSQMENMSMKESIAKLVRAEAYKRHFDQTTGSVSERKITAEELSSPEKITEIIYQNAHKKIKARTEMATELLASMKKILTYRISEREMNRMNIGGR